MNRTKENTLTLDLLGGIRQVGEYPDQVIDEIHGLYDDPVRSLSRIPGKKLATTGIADGPIWSLHQLRFRDRSIFMYKGDFDFFLSDEVTRIPGIRFTLPDAPSYQGPDNINYDNPKYPYPPPYTLLFDWPFPWPLNSPSPFVSFDRINRSGTNDLVQPVNSVENLAINFSSDLIEFTSLSSSRIALDIQKSESDVRVIGDKIGLSWESDWLRVWYAPVGAFSPPEYGLNKDNAAVPLGIWGGFSVAPVNLVISTSVLQGEASLPVGTYTDTITATALNEYGRLIQNPDGSFITDSMTVTLEVLPPELSWTLGVPIIFNVSV